MTGKLPLDRRRFLRIAGGAAAATAATALSSSVARAASIVPAVAAGTIEDVEHIVILMQENRSFDHYYGSMRGVRGFGDPHPALQPNGQAVWNQDGVLPFRPAAANLGLQFIEDLPHDWDTTHEAYDNGAYDRWVQAKGDVTMAYLTRDDIPFHYALADAFTVCDNYHCSLLTSTDPNRYYMWTGYCGNDGTTGSKGPTGPVIDNAEKGYDWQTYPERLQAAGVTWKVYQDVGAGLTRAGSWGWTSDAYIGNYGDNSLLYFLQYQNARPGAPLHERAITGTDVTKGGTFFDILEADVRNGTLPQVSWVVAPEAFCEHPNWPANYGAWYVSKVLDALTSRPEVWSKTVFILTYDENDGFFDHVVPPVPAIDPGGAGSTVPVTGEWYDLPESVNTYPPGWYGLGPRVPMLVVSPWSRGGWVNSELFDHTSLIRFIERRFGVAEPHISPWRRAVCGDLTSALDFRQANRSVPRLPSTAAYAPPDDQRHSAYVPVPPAAGAMPGQEPGLRPARPLPYDLAADFAVAGGTATVTFANRGAAGAVFHVTAVKAAARSYTIGAGDKLSGAWPFGAGQDIRVHGPNGFYRRLSGAGPDVTAVSGRGRLTLAVANGSPATVELTLTSAYHEKPRSFTVPPGATVPVPVPLAPGTRWYDVTLTADTDPSYLRGFAGHVENGQPDVSDPALGGARTGPR